MTDPQEEELQRLAEAKGLAVSVRHSTSLGRRLVEIRIGDPANDGRDAQTFHTFEGAMRFLTQE